MFVYLAMFFGIMLIYLWCSKGESLTDRQRCKFLFFSALWIVLIVGSRHNWYSFSDEGGYFNVYKSFIGASYSEFNDYIKLEEYSDVGYFYLNWVLAKIVPFPQFILYFECALFIGSMFFFIYRNTSKVFTAVMLMFGSGLFAFYMSALRQGCAFSFSILAYETLKMTNYERKFGKRIFWYILTILLELVAISMHKTSMIFIVILILQKIKSDKLKIFLSVVGVLITFILRNQLLVYGNDYFDREYTEGTAASFSGFVIQMIIYLLPLLMLWYSKRSVNHKKSIKDSGLIAGNLLGIGFYVVRLFSLVFERIAFYFVGFSFVLYGVGIDNFFNKQSRKYVYLGINIFCIMLFVWRICNGRNQGDFVFFWERD